MLRRLLLLALCSHASADPECTAGFTKYTGDVEGRLAGINSGTGKHCLLGGTVSSTVRRCPSRLRPK